MCYIREVYHFTKEYVGNCDDISRLREGKNMLLLHVMMMMPALH